MIEAHVIGNAALDETLRVQALPQPGASILGRMVSEDPGGKGLNQAVALARAGLTCTFTAAVGDDLRAGALRRALGAEPVRSNLLTRPDIATDLSVILLSDREDNVIVTTDAAARSLAPEDVTTALSNAAPGDLLLLQGCLSAATTRAALEQARARGLVACVNLSPLREYFTELLGFIDVAFVNEGEAEAFGGVAAMRRAGVARVIRTLGTRGAELHDDTGSRTVGAVQAEPVDTTGAGDSFMAACLASAALRASPPDALALRHAAEAAALTVSRAGTVAAFPTVAEFAEILSRH